MTIGQVFGVVGGFLYGLYMVLGRGGLFDVVV